MFHTHIYIYQIFIKYCKCIYIFIFSTDKTRAFVARNSENSANNFTQRRQNQEIKRRGASRTRLKRIITGHAIYHRQKPMIKINITRRVSTMILSWSDAHTHI